MPEALRSVGGIPESDVISDKGGDMTDDSAVRSRENAVERDTAVEGTPARGGTNPLAQVMSQVGMISGTNTSTGDVTDDARNLSLLADVESQVTRLLDLATQKGIPHAVHVARDMKNYYLLDRMHDEMVDRFYQGLVEKGLVARE